MAEIAVVVGVAHPPGRESPDDPSLYLRRGKELEDACVAFRNKPVHIEHDVQRGPCGYVKRAWVDGEHQMKVALMLSGKTEAGREALRGLRSGELGALSIGKFVNKDVEEVGYCNYIKPFEISLCRTPARAGSHIQQIFIDNRLFQVKPIFSSSIKMDTTNPAAAGPVSGSRIDMEAVTPDAAAQDDVTALASKLDVPTEKFYEAIRILGYEPQAYAKRELMLIEAKERAEQELNAKVNEAHIRYFQTPMDPNMLRQMPLAVKEMFSSMGSDFTRAETQRAQTAEKLEAEKKNKETVEAENARLRNENKMLREKIGVAPTDQRFAAPPQAPAPLPGQPIKVNDHVIVSSSAPTFVPPNTARYSLEPTSPAMHLGSLDFLTVDGKIDLGKVYSSNIDTNALFPRKRTK